jgi:hypothetical protein
MVPPWGKTSTLRIMKFTILVEAFLLYITMHLVFYTPVENGTYYGMAMSVRFSVRPSICPSVTLMIMTVSVHFLSDGFK